MNSWFILRLIKYTCANIGRMLISSILIGAIFSLPFFFANVWYAFYNQMSGVSLTPEFTVFVSKSSTDRQTEELRNKISAVASIEKAYVITKEEASAMVNAQLGIKSGTNTKSPLPDIIVATVGESVDSAEMAKIKETISAMQGVDQVAYDDEWVKALSSITSTLSATFFILCVLILIMAFAIIYASAHMATSESTKAEMKAMYLFGAKRADAIAPTCHRSTLMIFFGVLISVLLNYAIICFLSEPVAILGQTYGLSINLAMPSIWVIIAYVIALSFIGWMIAYSATRVIFKEVLKSC